MTTKEKIATLFAKYQAKNPGTSLRLFVVDGSGMLVKDSNGNPMLNPETVEFLQKHYPDSGSCGSRVTEDDGAGPKPYIFQWKDEEPFAKDSKDTAEVVFADYLFSLFPKLGHMSIKTAPLLLYFATSKVNGGLTMEKAVLKGRSFLDSQKTDWDASMLFDELEQRMNETLDAFDENSNAYHWLVSRVDQTVPETEYGDSIMKLLNTKVRTMIKQYLPGFIAKIKAAYETFAEIEESEPGTKAFKTNDSSDVSQSAPVGQAGPSSSSAVRKTPAGPSSRPALGLPKKTTVAPSAAGPSAPKAVAQKTVAPKTVAQKPVAAAPPGDVARMQAMEQFMEMQRRQFEQFQQMMQQFSPGVALSSSAAAAVPASIPAPAASKKKAPTPAAAKTPAKPPAVPRPRAARPPKEKKPVEAKQAKAKLSKYYKLQYMVENTPKEFLDAVLATFSSNSTAKKPTNVPSAALHFYYNLSAGPTKEIIDALFTNKISDEEASNLYNRSEAEEDLLEAEYKTLRAEVPSGYSELVKILGGNKKPILYLTKMSLVEHFVEILEKHAPETYSGAIDSFLKMAPTATKLSSVFRPDDTVKGMLFGFFQQARSDVKDFKMSREEFIFCLSKIVAMANPEFVKEMIAMEKRLLRTNVFKRATNGLFTADGLRYELAYEMNPAEKKILKEHLIRAKSIKRSQRVLIGYLVSLTRQKGFAEVDLTNIDSLIADATQNYPEPVDQQDADGTIIAASVEQIATYKLAMTIIRNLPALKEADRIVERSSTSRSIAHRFDIEKFLLDIKGSKSGGNDKIIRDLISPYSVNSNLLIWIFFVAAGIYFSDDSARGIAIARAVSSLQPYVDLLPVMPFQANMADAVETVFLKKPQAYTSKARDYISYMFKNHHVFITDPMSTSLEAEAIIASKKSSTAQKMEAYGHTAEDIVQGVINVKSTQWLRGHVKRVLGDDNLLERVAVKYAERGMQFKRPFATQLMLRIFEESTHMKKTLEENLAEATEKFEKKEANKMMAYLKEKAQFDALGKTAPEPPRRVEGQKRTEVIAEMAAELPTKRQAKLAALLAKGSLERPEEMQYGTELLKDMTAADAAQIYGYNEDVYPLRVRTEFGIAEAVQNFAGGPGFTDKDAKALKYILQENSLYPLVDIMTVYNDHDSAVYSGNATSVSEIAAIDAKKKFARLNIKTKFYEALGTGFVQPTPEKKIGFAIKDVQHALSMLNLLRLFSRLTNKQFLDISRAALLADSLKTANIAAQEIVKKFDMLVRAGKGDDHVLSPIGAQELILQARARVNQNVKLRNQKDPQGNTKNAAAEQTRIVLEAATRAIHPLQLAADDLAEIIEDVEKEIDNANALETENADANKNEDDEEEKQDEEERSQNVDQAEADYEKDKEENEDEDEDDDDDDDDDDEGDYNMGGE